MSHPHNYDRKTAPKAYLKRVFIESRPRQITFAGMIGGYRINVLELTQHYHALKRGNAEPIVAHAILHDVDGVHRIRGTVKHYILIIDDLPIACYDTEGRYIGNAEDEVIENEVGEARIAGSTTKLRIV